MTSCTLFSTLDLNTGDCLPYNWATIILVILGVISIIFLFVYFLYKISKHAKREEYY